MSYNLKEERLLKVLIKPCVTEKATFVGQYNQYVFRVMGDANKKEIKQAVELLFKVKVESVQVSIVNKKVKRVGSATGERNGWKKAFVKVGEGQRIDFASP